MFELDDEKLELGAEVPTMYMSGGYRSLPRAAETETSCLCR